MDFRELFKEILIADFKDLHVRADFPIDEIADRLIKVLENLNGINYVKMFGKCPMCMDCPDNCPIEKR